MRAAFRLIFAGSLAIWGIGQDPGVAIPRFQDFAVTESFARAFTQPILTSPDELRYRTVIRLGATKGQGVEDGATG
jgi:hypothetical protein